MLRRALMNGGAPVMLLALSACGGGSGTGTTAGTPSASVPAATPSPTASPVAVVPAPIATVPVALTPVPQEVSAPVSDPAPTDGDTPTGEPCTTVLGITYNIASLENPPYACAMLARGTVQRFEVRSGDRGWGGDAKNRNERSEIVTNGLWGTQKRLLYKSGVDTWLSYSFKVEPGEDITTTWAMVGQMHPVPDSTDGTPPPPFVFQIGANTGDKIPFTLSTRSDPNRDTLVAPPSVVRWATTITRGQWINLVMRVRFDPFGAGEIQLWANGVEQINLRNIPIGYNNAVDGNYWQYGIYRMQTVKTLAVRYANMEQGPDSLIARVDRPLPKE